ncbi:MAG: TRAP transporter small permease subunit [Burkholderiaceae bacterium]|jgi:TRAP-type mannitol/chloroaromatic compound transport system permease small subunit|nr:TRAP transporter small permease subunit [Burkholderiaceae bacterium]
MSDPIDVRSDEMIASRRSDTIDLPSDMPEWMQKTIRRIDGFSIRVGEIIAWLTLPLMLAMAYEIFVRYAFTAPTDWAYDISRMLYGAMFMIGAGYALQKGVHIRSDFLYRNWSVRTQAMVDITMYVFLFLPAMLIAIWVSTEWAWKAIENGERGMDTTWMPYLGPIKAALPVGILFLMIQGISELLKAIYAYRQGRWA